MTPEKIILGAMLKSKKAAEIILISLTQKDFQDAANRQIFAAMQNLYKNHSSIDLVTVDEQLTQWGKLDDVGGAAYLVELNNKTTDFFCTNIVAIIASVKEKSEKRRRLLRIQFKDGSYADVDPVNVIIINADSIKAIRPITSDESEVET